MARCGLVLTHHTTYGLSFTGNKCETYQPLYFAGNQYSLYKDKAENAVSFLLQQGAVEVKEKKEASQTSSAAATKSVSREYSYTAADPDLNSHLDSSLQSCSDSSEITPEIKEKATNHPTQDQQQNYNT